MKLAYSVSGKKAIVHYLPYPDNGQTACGLDVLKLHYHAYFWMNISCKRCKATKRFKDAVLR